MRDAGLNEHAAAHVPGPLWHVDAGRTIFIGPLSINAFHQHGAPVFLAGIYGEFGLRILGGRWLSCRTAVIPAGVVHELDVGGNPLAVFYIEPNLGGVGTLARLMRGMTETDGALVGASGEMSVLRDLWEDAASPRWVAEGLDDLLAYAQPRARSSFDRRISAAVDCMMRRSGDKASVADVAGAAGLSPSRFQHLFTREVGVPFRRYRAWSRMRAAIAEVARGSSFTTAAHAAGFADQAHFTNDFRRTFGAAPSHSMLRLRR